MSTDDWIALASPTVPSEGEEGSNLLPRLNSNAGDRLAHLRFVLGYLLLDVKWRFVAWAIFSLLAVVFPLTTCLFKYWKGKLETQDILAQIMLTVCSLGAMKSIRTLLCRNGLSRSVFLSELLEESYLVRMKLVERLRLRYIFVYIFFGSVTVLDISYRIYWFLYTLPSPHNAKDWFYSMVWFGISAIELISFAYRASVIVVSSFLLQVHSALQVLRMEGFAEILLNDDDSLVLYELQTSIEAHLKAISHSHQCFVALLSGFATLIQIYSIVILRGEELKFLIFGDLMLCWLLLVLSLIVCLISAVQITNRAQGIKKQMLNWHMRITISTSLVASSTTGEKIAKDSSRAKVDQQLQLLKQMMEGTEKMSSVKLDIGKRRAILSYMEGSSAGISLYGIILDGSRIYGLFMLQVSLVSWVVGLTRGFW
ncbi:hypothetical protein LUZ63_014966 [Rhynchospora breviuscula]|uniref:Uncharacterized protein n=1 Tax=Rhynchospora breviuscula TaxID=2022672 RepID=A0A9Q0CBC9_9POAL|nr:hypothetical protein LUZ63_014966 [Rhynchospora breviuscula]